MMYTNDVQSSLEIYEFFNDDRKKDYPIEQELDLKISKFCKKKINKNASKVQIDDKFKRTFLIYVCTLIKWI